MGDSVGVRTRQRGREWTRRMWWGGGVLICGVHSRGGGRGERVGCRV